MTIGFFSPLPLAMMIPFMATQSLAMGEAFGKSFQYGKRKISSMSNEEFNKLTMTEIMDEQTANIRMMIPKLTQQMEASSQMQAAIFTEMIKLVPAFINSITSALTGNTNLITGQTNFNQLNPPTEGSVYDTINSAIGGQAAGAEEYTGTTISDSGGAGIAHEITKLGTAGPGEPDKFQLSKLSHNELLELQKYRKSFGPQYQSELAYWIKRKTSTTTATVTTAAHKQDQELVNWLALVNPLLESLLETNKVWLAEDNSSIKNKIAKQFSDTKLQIYYLIRNSGSSLAGVKNGTATRENIRKIWNTMHLGM